MTIDRYKASENRALCPRAEGLVGYVPAGLEGSWWPFDADLLGDLAVTHLKNMS
jgi:hypothetical protein